MSIHISIRWEDSDGREGGAKIHVDALHVAQPAIQAELEKAGEAGGAVTAQVHTNYEDYLEKEQ